MSDAATTSDTPQRAHWKSRFGFVLAAAGSAIGLGNIWKFPYITGENGGGWFVLIYLACILLVGVPIMVAEIMIGRAGQKQPVGAFENLQGGKTAWGAIGWMGIAAGFIILSYYAVVAGWAMDYTLKSMANYTGPIHQQAEREAAAYIVSTDINEMRQTLGERRSKHEAKPQIAAIRATAKPSVWDAIELFESAIAKAPDATVARERLLLNATVKEQVETAEGLKKRIDEVEAAALKEAEQHYAALDVAALIAEAETTKRREITFAKVEETFLTTATDGWTAALWTALFMGLTISIVAGGVSAGIERTCRILMPTLFALICVMVVYGMFQPGFAQTIDFVFKPDLTKLKPSGVLEALGHAFFTLSLGMGAMITYGSYQQTKTGLLKESMLIALLDTVIALLACLMIYPIVFSYGQEPDAGPGLVFMSMPLAFAEIGTGGMLLAIAFFGLLVFAALTSAISLLEVVASYFIDQQGWSRPRAAWTLGGVILLFGLPSAFSLDPDFMMTGWEPSFGMNFFKTMDYLASNWLLPLGGLFIAIYAGWVMPHKLRAAEMEDSSALMIGAWLLLIRFVAPAMVILVLMQKVGILDADELLHGLL